MVQLTQRDLQSVVGFLRGLYALRDVSAFASHVLTSLPTVVPAEVSGYSKVDSALRRVSFAVAPAGRKFPGCERVFERHMHEHPFIAYRRRTLVQTALKLSDFLSREQFHRLGLYNEFYRRIGVEHLMSVPLRLRPPVEIAVAVARKGRDFSERDRLVLNLLRPHLAAAQGNAETVGQIQPELALVGRGVEAVDRGIVFLAPAGRVRLMTTRARELLVQYFEGASSRADHLPELLQRWVRHQEDLLARTDEVPPPREPLVVDRDEERLVARLFSDPAQGVLLLDEQPTGIRSSVPESLGLTPREGDVLAWVAEGKTNAEVGTILGLSPRTVQKHLEHIYPKLGVETRTAAARILQAAAPSNLTANQ